MSFNEFMNELKSLPLVERIKCVADDIDSRNDRFPPQPAHELAELLHVPCPEQPDGNWEFTSYVERCSAEEILDSGAGVEPLKEISTQDRYECLCSALDSGELDCSLLTPEERNCIEGADMERRLHNLDTPTVIAHFTVPTPDGRELGFEGLIEDDGTCIDLLGPYDDREGRFRDLSDCLIGF
jgi:hypothetical protein